MKPHQNFQQRNNVPYFLTAFRMTGLSFGLSGGLYLPGTPSWGLGAFGRKRFIYEQPVVIPQSSHTLQVPFCLTLMEPQFSHCSPV